MAVGGGRQPLVSVSFFLFVFPLPASVGFLNLCPGGLAVCFIPQTSYKMQRKVRKNCLGCFLKMQVPWVPCSDPFKRVSLVMLM